MARDVVTINKELQARIDKMAEVLAATEENRQFQILLAQVMRREWTHLQNILNKLAADVLEPEQGLLLHILRESVDRASAELGVGAVQH